MKVYVQNIIGAHAAGLRITAAIENQQIQVSQLSEADRKKFGVTTEPVLETAEGAIAGFGAAARYISALGGGKLLGASAINKSHVDQWLAWSNTTLAPTVETVSAGIFGHGKTQKAAWEEASKALKAHVKLLNTQLDGKKWLAGDDMTLADVVLALSLQEAFQTVLDAGFRKAMAHATAWANSVYARPEYVKVQGTVQLAAKGLKPFDLVEPPKPEKKKEAPKAAAPKAAAPAKKKDNVESLPPTPFNVYDFKTFYVNHPDKKGAAVDEWYKMLDWDGWAFWFFHYDKYGDEGTVLHVTNNLVTGFMSRAEHTSKYTFARHGVFGEEPNLEIMGVWLCRGPTELPDGLAKEHPQMEYYRARRMDPRNVPEDDKLVRDFFGGQEDEILGGLKA